MSRLVRLIAQTSALLPSRLRDHWNKSAKAFAHSRRARRAGRPDVPDDTEFELTPFGRRRKRVARPSTWLGVAAVALVGCLAWFLM